MVTEYLVGQELACFHRGLVKQLVSSRDSIHLGELVGMKMALKYISRSIKRGEGIRKARLPECYKSINIRMGV